MAKAKRMMDEVTVKLPIGELPPDSTYENIQIEEGHVSIEDQYGRLHVEAPLGTGGAEAFLRVRNGLKANRAKLGDGQAVKTNVDALRYIMEQVAAEIA